jgi:hypothetical protein
VVTVQSLEPCAGLLSSVHTLHLYEWNVFESEVFDVLLEAAPLLSELRVPVTCRMSDVAGALGKFRKRCLTCKIGELRVYALVATACLGVVTTRVVHDKPGLCPRYWCSAYYYVDDNPLNYAGDGYGEEDEGDDDAGDGNDEGDDDAGDGNDEEHEGDDNEDIDDGAGNGAGSADDN